MGIRPKTRPIKGIGLIYHEPKKVFTFSITSTANNLLKQTAKLLGFSKSEFLEKIARGELSQKNKIDVSEETLILLEQKSTSVGLTPSELIYRVARAELKSEFNPQLKRHCFLLWWL